MLLLAGKQAEAEKPTPTMPELIVCPGDLRPLTNPEILKTRILEMSAS